MSQTITKFTISRSEWLRGEGIGDTSRLLRPSDSKRCCLGIYAREVGLSDELTCDVESPAGRGRLIGKWPEKASWLFEGGGNSRLAFRLMEDNDRADLTEGQREARIKAEFAEAGIEVEFVD